ncbi:MAG: late competence development ComFB family protein [Rubrivivax sp.]|nr:late competence development ComFB family protein [Rubrivivax sp.]MDH5340857.1 late competence development ComFB family protein [Rubrivivax sp.]
MSVDFSSVRNHNELAVFDAVTAAIPQYPGLATRGDLLADVACVALNRLPARYIRHAVDLAFYQTERERADSDKALRDAVDFAFGFVQARVAMRARA